MVFINRSGDANIDAFAVCLGVFPNFYFFHHGMMY